MSNQPAPQPSKPVPHGVEHQVAMRELADVISSIRPDPKYARNCHQSNCNGKRGYHAISCYITEDGKKHYQVEMCCGMVGESEYTRIRRSLEEGLQRIEGAISQLLTGHMEIRMATRETLRQTHLTHRMANEAMENLRLTWWGRLRRLFDRVREKRNPKSAGVPLTGTVNASGIVKGPQHPLVRQEKMGEETCA